MGVDKYASWKTRKQADALTGVWQTDKTMDRWMVGRQTNALYRGHIAQWHMRFESWAKYLELEGMGAYGSLLLVHAEWG